MPAPYIYVIASSILVTLWLITRPVPKSLSKQHWMTKPLYFLIGATWSPNSVFTERHKSFCLKCPFKVSQNPPVLLNKSEGSPESKAKHQGLLPNCVSPKQTDLLWLRFSWGIDVDFLGDWCVSSGDKTWHSICNAGTVHFRNTLSCRVVRLLSKETINFYISFTFTGLGQKKKPRMFSMAVII